MKNVRIAGALALALFLALGASACQKKAETELGQVGDEGMTSTDQTVQGTAEAPASPEATPPAGAKDLAASKSTSGSKPSSTTKSSATYATQTKTVEVPVGTVFDIALVTPVDTRTSNVGDKLEAKLAAPIVHDGVVIAEEGAMIRGEITALQRASRSKGEEDRASVTLAFTELKTVDGTKQLHATVTNSEGKMVAKSTGKRDRLIIGGSAVAGAILGKVAGKDTKSTVIGAVGGAAVGTGAVLATKGYELEVPAGSKVTLRVDQPIVVAAK